jgi:hypothetical protein
MKVSQKQAVRNAIFSVLEDRGESYELNGPVAIGDVFNSDDKANAREILFTGFKNGEIEYKDSFQSKVDDDTELKKYVSGLLNNWMRKDKELNCGEVYKAKNPGSRAGSQDSKIKEMRKLLKVTTDESAKAMIQEAITARLAEIKPAQTVEIDASALPEHLQHLVPSTESTEEVAE